MATKTFSCVVKSNDEPILVLISERGHLRTKSHTTLGDDLASWLHDAFSSGNATDAKVAELLDTLDPSLEVDGPSEPSREARGLFASLEQKSLLASKSNERLFRASAASSQIDFASFRYKARRDDIVFDGERLWATDAKSLEGDCGCPGNRLRRLVGRFQTVAEEREGYEGQPVKRVKRRRFIAGAEDAG